MSASTSPVLAPIFPRAMARFVETVDFPTPPFPDATAIIFLTADKDSEPVFPLFFTDESRITSTSNEGSTICLIAVMQAFLIMSLRGQAGERGQGELAH